MRWFMLLFVLGGCRPTSLLELDVFVGSSALDLFTSDLAVYVDFGPGQLPMAISLCEWDEGFRETSLDDIEYAACPETTTITGVLAPIPEGNTCNEGAVFFFGPPDDVEGFPTASIEVFADDNCSVIETHRLTIGVE